MKPIILNKVKINTIFNNFHVKYCVLYFLQSCFFFFFNNSGKTIFLNLTKIIAFLLIVSFNYFKIKFILFHIFDL